MSKPLVIYLASPYTYKAAYLPLRQAMENMRYEQITKIAAGLVKRYNVAPICPITMSANFSRHDKSLKGEFDGWASIDYAYIDCCDEVWVATMKGWDISVGVTSEIQYAMKNRKLVRYINEDTLNLSYIPDPITLEDDDITGLFNDRK